MFNIFNNYNRESSIENKNEDIVNQKNLEEAKTIEKCLEKTETAETDLNQENPVQVNATMDFDTLQKARQDLVGEIQAVIEYDEHLHNTTDRLARETWENIKHEELTHAGELMALINHLDPTQKQYVDDGIKEFTERMNK